MHRFLSTLLVVMCFGLALRACAEPAQQWSITQGTNSVTLSSEGLHIISHVAPAPSEASAIRPLSIPSGLPWEVSFDVRLMSVPGSMSVHLMHSDHDVGWMGADGFYKAMSAFTGTGNAHMAGTHPIDAAWHHFEYVSDGATLSVWKDGQQEGEGPSQETPNAVRVTSLSSELWMRNVHFASVTSSTALMPQSAWDFSKPGASLGTWQQTLNGGSVAVDTALLRLTGNGRGYPVLVTSRNPFPASSDWTVSWAYRYSSIGNYGTEMRCDCPGGDAFALIHQDVNGQFLMQGGKTLWRVPANTDWHVVSLVRKADQTTAYVDGQSVGSGSSGKPPTALKIGGGLMTNPWDWNDLEVQSVRVDVGARPLDRMALLPERRALQGTEPAQAVATVPAMAPAPVSSSEDALPAGLQANTIEALANNLVDVKRQNLTTFDMYLIYDLAVTNHSSKPVWFWTTPTVVFANGTFATTQSELVRNSPFRSFASQINEAFSYANSAQSFSGTVQGSPGTVVQRAGDTIILPHQTLYFHCQSAQGTSDVLPDHISFHGGGWDKTVLQLAIPGVNNLPQ